MNRTMQKVSLKPAWLSKRIASCPHLCSESGQMAIFVALIFQVLFVFFAMAINVGLVVHDKINLQNSVDLAAYYAAQRQAEWLNIVAHQNYQIRQSFKVYAWRYWVMGTIGQKNPPHPARVGGSGADVPFYPESEVPALCVSYRPNFRGLIGGSENADNICKEKKGIAVSSIRLPYGYGHINAMLVGFTQDINQQITTQCQEYGGVNYFYVNAIRRAYQLDQFRLMDSIRAVARNLGRSIVPGNGSMIDLNGDTVFQGTQNTLVKNLTFENRSTLQEIQVYNSIDGLSPEAWLNEIKIKTHGAYVDIQNRDGCFSRVEQATNTPARTNQALSKVAQATGMSEQQVQDAFNNFRLSYGFEKNPWRRLYVGVRARTRPRQIFFPFGDGVQMEAVAYAQPFGATIGPWYRNVWLKSSNASSGGRLDNKAPPQVNVESGEIEDVNELKYAIPNFSKFPKDPLGMNSVLAQKLVDSNVDRILFGFISLSSGMREGANPDPLTWDGDGGPHHTRKLEITAAAPNLFDIAYYTIIPNFGKTYLPKLQSLARDLGIPAGSQPRPDLGGRAGSGNPYLEQFSVDDQMAVASGQARYLNENQAPYQHQRKPWIVRDRAHLLTSWVHNNTIAAYPFPSERFGKCGTWDDDLSTNKIPGSCIYNGGRAGYSVKLVSGDYLRSPGEFGGAGTPSDTIDNTPSW